MSREDQKKIKNRFRKAKETFIEMTCFMRPSLYTKEEYRRFWKNYFTLVLFIILIVPAFAILYDLTLLFAFGARF